MIKRLISLLFLAWILGFAWFALLLPLPAVRREVSAADMVINRPDPKAKP